MKKLLAIVLTMALLTTGCHSRTPVQTQPETSAPVETAPSQTLVQPENGMLFFGDSGKLRIRYEGNRSGVLYITASDQLPREDALSGFDEAFFAQHALVLVTYTAASGSAQPEIQTITVDGDTALVSVDVQQSGTVGTMDMATWLLWAVVDRDLTYNWVLENDTVYPGHEIS